jgi:hypothetical protein
MFPRNKFLHFCLLLGIALLVGSGQAIAQDRANPLPLPGSEIKGTLRPGLRSETFYACEASGNLEFTLSITSFQDFAMLEVEVLDASFVPLLKFDASSSTPNGSDKREARLRLDGKQVVFFKFNAPSANKSGSFNLKIKGSVTPLRTTVAAKEPAAPPPAQTAPPVQTPTAVAENRTETKTTNEISRPKDTPVKAAEIATAVPTSLREIGTAKRIALIIGNAAYEGVPLRNPVNDARAMAEVLAECGFEVMMVENADKRRMEESIRTFGQKLAPDSAGLFYFAGHGLQVGGTNYLIPLGVKIEKESDVEYEAVDAGRVMAEFANAKNVLSIMILDACRDNPFAATTRSLTRGLAVVRLPKEANGVLIAYATSPGNVARDGTGKNGLYTEELLRNLRTPGLKVEDVFKLTRVGVKQRSNGAQVPWENSSIDGDFYFARKTK